LPEAVRESSGLVASRKHPGVFWTLSDSGNPPALFAVTREGALVREYAVAAKNVDWEDLAIDGDGRLYIADVGNNQRDRKEVMVMRVDEPDPRAPLPASGVRPAPLRVTNSWRLTFPGDQPFDCESLFVLGGKGYVLPKRLNASPAEVYRFELAPTPRPQKLERVATIPTVRAPVTAADVSPDGKRVAVLTVFGPYVFQIDGDVAAVSTAKPSFSRYLDPHMEAACFVDDGTALLATSETRDVLLFRAEHFTPPLANR
jgi:hypothetical protein